jgi:hypothetical protein
MVRCSRGWRLLGKTELGNRAEDMCCGSPVESINILLQYASE